MSKSLLGRQVYFKMSKLNCKHNHITCEPHSLYTINSVEDSGLVNVTSKRTGNQILISLSKMSCSHLNCKASWILKRLPKNK